MIRFTSPDWFWKLRGFCWQR